LNQTLVGSKEISQKAWHELMKEVAIEAKVKAMKADKILFEKIDLEINDLIKRRNIKND
jgi:hypothetical protein